MSRQTTPTNPTRKVGNDPPMLTRAPGGMYMTLSHIFVCLLWFGWVCPVYVCDVCHFLDLFWWDSVTTFCVGGSLYIEECLFKQPLAAAAFITNLSKLIYFATAVAVAFICWSVCCFRVSGLSVLVLDVPWCGVFAACRRLLFNIVV